MVHGILQALAVPWAFLISACPTVSLVNLAMISSARKHAIAHCTILENLADKERTLDGP
jgi:hypothetical protein